jgi:mono/diheme cytochrome c family protein
MPFRATPLGALLLLAAPALAWSWSRREPPGPDTPHASSPEAGRALASALAAHVQEGPAPPRRSPLDAPVTPAQARRAEWLLAERVACLGCHRLGGEGGRIGPPLDGLAERLEPAYVRAIIDDPARAAPGGAMPDQPLSDEHVELLSRYLLSRGGSGRPAETADPPSGAAPARDGAPGPDDDDSGTEDGAVLYGRWCAACHGAEGRGDGWNAVDLPVRPDAHADPERMAARSDDALRDAIYGGGWVLGRSARMPAFGATLTPGQIDALVDHIRRLCACQGPAWSRDGRGGGR